MAWLEAKIPVQHLVWTEGGEDELGDPIEGWADPATLMVYGIAPVAQSGDQEPGTGRDAVVTVLQLLCPPGAAVGPQDRYIIDGLLFEQEGLLADYTRGPFDWAPGIVVTIKRVTG